MGKLIIMIRSRTIFSHPALFHKASAALSLMALLSILPANAAPTPKKAPAALPIDPVPVISDVLSERPSRYISSEELQAYVQTVSLNFSIKSRSTDPFGQQQNPDAQPKIKPPTTRTAGPKILPSQIKPFAEIVNCIRVTTVMPAERRFLIGDRSFKQGDRFPMKFRERSIKVEVAKVSSREITFRNIENSETASLKLTLMPPGMSPSNGKITPPGMISENTNAPLEIDPASTPGANPLN